jgi:hypothetical protein
MNRFHPQLILVIICLWVSTYCSAQFGVEIEMSYGAAIQQGNNAGPDRFGQSTTGGLNLAYYTEKPWARAVGLSLRYHWVVGLVGIQNFSQEVPALDADDPATLVSLRAYIPGYRAVSAGLFVEFDQLWSCDQAVPRFSYRAGLGLLRLNRQAPRVEWYEQTSEGDRLGPRNFGETFNVRDGKITRFRRGFFDPIGNNAMRRYQAYAELQLSYQLTPYLRVFNRNFFTLGTLGQRYGEDNDESLLGRVNNFEFGVLGRL